MNKHTQSYIDRTMAVIAEHEAKIARLKALLDNATDLEQQIIANNIKHARRAIKILQNDIK